MCLNREPDNGSIPVLTASGRTLSEMWENSMLELWQNGASVRTQYDRKNDKGEYIDLPSRDCTMLMVCTNPFAEPMLHRAFPGGIEDLEEYRMEVVEGVKNHWIRDKNDPLDERWEYTYNDRLTKFKYLGRESNPAKPGTSVADDGLNLNLDQLEWLVCALAEDPITRRAIIHTWRIGEDNEYKSPPCLQGIWARAVPVNDTLVLNMNVRFRSRDAYDAAFMNCFAFIFLMQNIADRLSLKTGKKVVLGRYTDFSDSYHIYGRRIEDFQNRFMKLHSERTFEERTWNLADVTPIMHEANPKILEKIAKVDAERCQ